MQENETGRDWERGEELEREVGRGREVVREREEREERSEGEKEEEQRACATYVSGSVGSVGGSKLLCLQWLVAAFK
jgi:hypothetical protein